MPKRKRDDITPKYVAGCISSLLLASPATESATPADIPTFVAEGVEGGDSSTSSSESEGEEEFLKRPRFNPDDVEDKQVEDIEALMKDRDWVDRLAHELNSEESESGEGEEGESEEEEAPKPTAEAAVVAEEEESEEEEEEEEEPKSTAKAAVVVAKEASESDDEKAPKQQPRPEKKKKVSNIKYHPHRTLFIKNLSYDITEELLGETFAPCGGLKTATLFKNNSGRPTGFAYIEFESEKALAAALEMNGKEVLDRALSLERYSSEHRYHEGKRRDKATRNIRKRDEKKRDSGRGRGRGGASRGRGGASRGRGGASRGRGGASRGRGGRGKR